MNTLLLGVAMTVAAPNLKDKPKAEPTIVGEWAVETVTNGGRAATLGANLRYTFTKDGKWLVDSGDQEMPLANGERTFTMDPKASPPAVDLITTRNNGAGGTHLVGIFKIEGDTLTILGTRTQGGERPKNFDAPDAVGISVYVLKRVKAK